MGAERNEGSKDNRLDEKLEATIRKSMEKACIYTCGRESEMMAWQSSMI